MFLNGRTILSLAGKIGNANTKCKMIYGLAQAALANVPALATTPIKMVIASEQRERGNPHPVQAVRYRNISH